MDFRRFKLRLLVLPAAAALTAVAASGTQSPVTNALHSIVFSSPTNSDTSSNLTSSLSEQPLSSSGLQSRLQMYQDSSPVALHGSPVPGPAPIPRQVIRVHKSSNDSVGWEFMTPAQILGVSPDQILQAQDRNADSDQSGLTRLERILLGRNPANNFKAAAAGNASALQNSWSDVDNNQQGVFANLLNSGLGNLQSDASGLSVNDAGNNNPFANGGDKSAWSKLFGLPSPPPEPNSIQQLRHQEDMKQFMQLLNPGSAGSAAASATTASSDDTTPSQTATPFSDFDSITPLANPLGNPFASLTGNTSSPNGIGKPAGLTPLPSITRQANSQSAVRPAWAPQPPPWLSPTPQPFAIPRGKF